MRAALGVAAALAVVPVVALEPPPDGGGETLTVDSQALRPEGGWAIGLFDKLPDVRLGIERPEEIVAAQGWLEPRVRSLEIRLPASFVWMGYEWGDGEEAESRATFRVRRSF